MLHCDSCDQSYHGMERQNIKFRLYTLKQKSEAKVTGKGVQMHPYCVL